MQEYQQRVVDEKVALDDKCEKLSKFFSSEKAKSLSPEERLMLAEQGYRMTQYSNVLGRRIAAFK